MPRAWENIPPHFAIPIVAAFVLQISFYLLPALPSVGRRLTNRLSPARLAAFAVVASILPYLAYSLPTGVFQFAALLKLSTVCLVLGFLFVLFPTRSRSLTWQDLAALSTIAIVMLGRLWRQVYLSPVEGLRIEVLGQILLIGLGALAFLSLRNLEGVGYRLHTSAADWREGTLQFVLFLPIGLPVALWIGVVRFHPFRSDPWLYPIYVVGTFLGIYLVLALFEEFFFRGVLQNLLAQSIQRPLLAQAIVSVLFGLCHLPFRGFPNWRFALVDAILGWFCGQAYRRRGTIVASCITHALVVTSWRLLFS